MINREYIINKLSQIKDSYTTVGVEIVGIFGSVAKNRDTFFSDIDIAYKINKNIFFKKYKDGFSQILKLEEIKNSLEKELNRKIDFVDISYNQELQKEATKDMIYV